MIKIEDNNHFLVGPKGSLCVKSDDEITLKLAMLFEAECEGNSRSQTANKFGYTRQRYYQILNRYLQGGAEFLKSERPGPRTNYRKTDEVIRQIIRYRFLDPKMSSEVISQRLKQCGYQIGIRSVEQVISDYGLQKKTLLVSPQKRDKDRDAS